MKASRIGTDRRLATRHRSADDSPGLLLWQVTNRWQAAQRAALKPFGLTHVQFVLLASLTWLDSEGPVTQRRLADHAATDPMMTSQVLRTLEQRELLQRAEHPDDKRARSLTPTAAGVRLANKANAAVEACDNAFFAGLGPHVARFTTDLRVLREQTYVPAVARPEAAR
jgi:DNA-binding MarR family transcriptional regulator